MKIAFFSLLITTITSTSVLMSNYVQAHTTSTQATAVAPTIRLVESSQYALRLRTEPNRIAISNPDAVDVTLLPNASGSGAQILLSGIQAGRADLHVWYDNKNQPQHWQIIVDSALQKQLQDQHQTPEATIQSTAGDVLISGHSSSLLDHQKAHDVAKSIATKDGSITDISTVGTTGMVQIEVQIAELSSKVMKDIGINWYGGKSGGNWNTTSPGSIVGNTTSLIGSGFGIAFSGSKHFSARLNLLQSNGLARVLAEPTLVAMSGQSASFLSGGAIPVPSSGGLGTQNVEYKEFGIGLTVSPTILSNDRIALKVAPESSDLDYGNAIQSGDSLIPALRVRKTDTFVELGDGESFVISGLVSRSTMANVDKMPILGDLPILGAFFRNLSYSQDERELVIIVTPRLVRPIAANTELPLPGAQRERLDTTTNAWGAYLMGPVIGQSLPGFTH